jgi:LysM repeat protein
MYKFVFAVLFSVITLTVAAQRMSIEEYVAQFKEVAINEMKRSGVPASITLAQGILESESGNSELVKKSNNHFGIKCKSNWSGDSVTHDDDAAGECFRAYKNAGDSYRDHSDFLLANKRYSPLFNLDPTDYAGWARGLKKAGYATNPQYPQLLIKYIELYNLQQYSLTALNELPKMDIAKTGDADEVPPVEKVEAKIASSNTNIATNAVLTGVAPDKATNINGTKCIYVKKGTSILVIANANNIDLSRLLDFNDMTLDGILEKDQYIYLRKKPKTGDKDFYQVQPGQNLYDVSQDACIQLKYLLEYNKLTANSKIAANTKLALQPNLNTVALVESSKNTKVHTVIPKEGLYSIAKNYKVTVQQLKEWNSLDSDDLKIGQEIIVSK